VGEEVRETGLDGEREVDHIRADVESRETGVTG